MRDKIIRFSKNTSFLHSLIFRSFDHSQQFDIPSICNNFQLIEILLSIILRKYQSYQAPKFYYLFTDWNKHALVSKSYTTIRAYTL